MEDILDQLFAYNSVYPVFVAKIVKADSIDQDPADSYDPPNSYEDNINEETAVMDFNNALTPMVNGKPGNLYLVDMQDGAGLNYFGDFQDGVHPNDGGYDKIGAKWFDEIQKYFTPSLALPEDNATNQSVNVELSWNAPDGAAISTPSYHLQVDDDSDFSSPIYDFSGLASNSKTMSSLANDTEYFWRIQATNFDGKSYWTERSFTTAPSGMVVSAKVFLEGPFNGTDMNTSLATADYIPNANPYSSAPWNHSGGESVPGSFDFAANNIVDWVLVEVRDQSTPSSVLGIRAAFVRNDGRLFDTDGTLDVNFSGLAADNYYIVIKHRNHLAVMSSSPVSLSSSSTLYDFTTAQSKAYGTNPMKDFGGSKFGMFAGDANADGGIKYNGADNDRGLYILELGG